MIVVLMGAPGAGKSTWTRNHMTGMEHIYNIDAIRLNPELDVNSYTNFHRKKAVIAVEDGKWLIADATHTIKPHRDLWRNLGDRLGVETKLIMFDTPLATLLEVQKTREFPVAQKVVVDHYRKMQFAKHAVAREGWGSIESIKR